MVFEGQSKRGDLAQEFSLNAAGIAPPSGACFRCPTGNASTPGFATDNESFAFLYCFRMRSDYTTYSLHVNINWETKTIHARGDSQTREWALGLVRPGDRFDPDNYFWGADWR